MTTRMMTAGTATTAEVCRHWGVCDEVARRSLRAAGAEPVRRGLWRWRDVWRAEGSPHVPAVDWADFKRPLMDAQACAEADREAGRRRRSERTWRRRIQSRRLPVVELAPGLRRVRSVDYDAHADAL